MEGAGTPQLRRKRVRRVRRGQNLTVPDETGADLIRGGYDGKIEEETEEETGNPDI